MKILAIIVEILAVLLGFWALIDATNDRKKRGCICDLISFIIIAITLISIFH